MHPTSLSMCQDLTPSLKQIIQWTGNCRWYFFVALCVFLLLLFQFLAVQHWGVCSIWLWLHRHHLPWITVASNHCWFWPLFWHCWWWYESLEYYQHHPLMYSGSHLYSYDEYKSRLTLKFNLSSVVLLVYLPEEYFNRYCTCCPLIKSY